MKSQSNADNTERSPFIRWMEMRGQPITEEENRRMENSHRAGGMVVCKQCGKTYIEHPHYEPSAKTCGYAWLHELCNGDLVKL